MRAVGIVAVAIATEVVVEKLVMAAAVAPQLKLPPVQLRKLLPVQAVKCAPKRLVVEALVTDKLVVVALLLVAFRIVISWIVEEAVTSRFVVLSLVVVEKVDQREVPVPSPTKTVPLTSDETPVPSLASIASRASLALLC
jgi:hypothetical protein